MNGHSSRPSLNIAIIGTGIVGAHVAIGLLNRNIPVTIYEQSSEAKDIGAGIVLPTIAVECMDALDPDITKRVKNIAGGLQNVNFINGCSDEDLKLRSGDGLYDIEIKPFEYHPVHRAQLLSELLHLIPQDRIQFGKRLESIVDRGNDAKMLLRFYDGTTAEADAVIGCDGIKSRVRQIVLGPENPAAFPHYTHLAAYRGLVPMDKATAALGRLSKEAVMYVGQGASIMTYPIISRDVVNVAAFVWDEGDWPDSDHLTDVGSKEDVMTAFSHFGPTLREFVSAMPEKLNRWALFDSHDHPLSSFAYGRIALAGDAAHASTPFHGAGASMGIEDALVLATLLKRVADIGDLDQGPVTKDSALKAAFKAYDSVRRERAQWLVSSSRCTGLSVQWRTPEIGKDADLFAQDVTERMEKIFSYDWKDSLAQAIDEFERHVGA
ncbi:hypothetical protein Trco_003090 [Trichoderma cornu-damae]|uniref:FAD-binding domain-containing protein n=1 Tax=Trichoderma cornu-damae TaxID=654480 RepID=A0A9P8TZR1_9HYPO|nr:hypothetical protein Trco_003090 [Trichoderma cornu-damae]